MVSPSARLERGELRPLCDEHRRGSIPRSDRQHRSGGLTPGPRVGPLVINEIHYHPPIGGDEFIELKSITNGVLNLYNSNYPSNTWRLNGIGFSFPADTQVAPGSLVCWSTDPVAFRTKFCRSWISTKYPGLILENCRAAGKFSPSNPPMTLIWIPTRAPCLIPYIDKDVVHYNDKAPVADQRQRPGRISRTSERCCLWQQSYQLESSLSREGRGRGWITMVIAAPS